ncbi:PAS domain-containing protein [Mucilaginibacter antarcticus]|uniref:PAS domain-containing protein n=1 Tax=Mucilaginibacter antarcticus TaxID=1855725 RepID=UPI003638B68C
MKSLTHKDIRRVYNLNSMAVIGIDIRGVIMYANNAVVKFLHAEDRQLLGQSVFNFFMTHLAKNPIKNYYHLKHLATRNFR